MASTVSAPGAPSRRERLRAATLAEIRTAGRRLLVNQGATAVTLRAIAREMGVTPAALYRYVESHEDLMVLLGVEIHDELTAALEAVRDTLPAEAAPQRLLACSREFRRYALAHRNEFQLVFANPLPDLMVPCEGPLEAAAQRIGHVFAGLFADLVQRGFMRIPESADVDPAVLAAVSQAVTYDMPLPLFVRFVQCWTMLYGCVCMEVFGHLAWAMDDTEPMFELTIRQCAELLGIGEYYQPPSGPA
jgi:AcrR family transcriptional regulator